MPRQIPFDPAKVQYSRRYIRNPGRLKDGSRPSQRGPYWYACWMEGGRYRSFYLGKDLPDSLRPYVSDEQMAREVELRPEVSKQNRGRRFRYDSLQETLSQGQQVVIDLNHIAYICKAHYNKIGPDRFVLYRDPE